MKTLTVTAARQNLGAWLKRSLKGEDVGVTIDGEVVAFRPVKV
jgi:antitoxin (DNA-binding transcriptional repressor) of toxin-antitoxin stability system